MPSVLRGEDNSLPSFHNFPGADWNQRRAPIPRDMEGFKDKPSYRSNAGRNAAICFAAVAVIVFGTMYYFNQEETQHTAPKPGADNEGTDTEPAFDNSILQFDTNTNSSERSIASASAAAALAAQQIQLQESGHVSDESAPELLMKMAKREFLFTSDMIDPLVAKEVEEEAKRLNREMKKLERVLSSCDKKAFTKLLKGNDFGASNQTVVEDGEFPDFLKVSSKGSRDFYAESQETVNKMNKMIKKSQCEMMAANKSPASATSQTPQVGEDREEVEKDAAAGTTSLTTPTNITPQESAPVEDALVAVTSTEDALAENKRLEKELERLRAEVAESKSALQTAYEEKVQQQSVIQKMVSEQQMYATNLSKALASKNATKASLAHYKSKVEAKQLQRDALLHKLKESGVEVSSAGKLIKEQVSKGVGVGAPPPFSPPPMKAKAVARAKAQEMAAEQAKPKPSTKPNAKQSIMEKLLSRAPVR